MDGLALLCNLFADGPVTLRRLRAAGLGSLVALERADPVVLAEVLHASVPQARAFAEEARKLARRLAEEQPPPAAPAPNPAREAAPVGAAPASPQTPRPSGGERRLVPGLLPGLDAALCERLALHRVTTVQALGEFAGLALARRTGTPYSTLLALSLEARRSTQARPRDAGQPAPARAEQMAPFLIEPRRAPTESDLAPTDGFTLPAAEPESAGPFG